jgi:arylsulfatase A-like enzyme
VAGGLVPTPNINSIAREGADFTTAYAGNATCSPSRAALMTGRYPTRFGFEFTAVPDQLAKYVPRYSPNNRPYQTIYHADLEDQVPSMGDMGMPASELTIAEILKTRLSHDPSRQMAPWRGSRMRPRTVRRKPRLHARRVQI